MHTIGRDACKDPAPMGDLVRTMVICGLISGTQPITIMGLLLVSSAERSKACGWAYLGGCLAVESAVLLVANAVLGGTVEPTSPTGKVFVGVRIAVGVALVVVGVLLRRPARKPPPEVPKSLTRLQTLTPVKAFLAGAVLADYQGPVLGSLAIASAGVSAGARLVSVLIYTLIATGIPTAIFLLANRSERAHARLDAGSTWVMKNRRPLASWIAIVGGLLLLGDGLIVLAGTT
jgi:hypothetical protein